MQTKKIEDILLSAETKRFNRLGFYEVDDLLSIGNLKKDSENYSLEFADLFRSSFDLSTKKDNQNFYEVRVFHKHIPLNDPKSGKVIFDVPNLIDKDIDQIMENFGKASYKYADSISSSGYLHKKDENSQLSLLASANQGTFSYTKDGWTLIVPFNLESRKINHIDIIVDGVEFNGFESANDLLVIANLENVASDYKVVYSDENHRDTELPSEDYHNFSGIKIYPKNK